MATELTEAEMSAKFIQIQVDSSEDGTIWALDERGTVWYKDYDRELQQECWVPVTSTRSPKVRRLGT